jgi:hypothetical protein
VAKGFWMLCRDTAKLLLEAGADVRARNFAGDQPHQLTVQGNPLWETLIAELDWRACLEQPRLCQFAAAAGEILIFCDCFRRNFPSC